MGDAVEIKKLCVLGAGLMGNGIAQICAQAGYAVFMRDIEQRFIDGGMNTIRKNLNRDVEKGKITKWMLPKLIAFSDDIPKTSVGKYNKREIKKQLDRFLALAREM